MQIMTPNHVRWDEFCIRLDDELAAAGGCAGDASQGDNPGQHEIAKRILSDMGDFDVARSIAFFCAHAGYCDCEILLNVEFLARAPIHVHPLN